jgi:hypothetical protein
VSRNSIVQNKDEEVVVVEDCCILERDMLFSFTRFCFTDARETVVVLIFYYPPSPIHTVALLIISHPPKGELQVGPLFQVESSRK